jgi:hypothetical protein
VKYLEQQGTLEIFIQTTLHHLLHFKRSYKCTNL